MESDDTPAKRGEVWEEFISLNNTKEKFFKVLDPAATHVEASTGRDAWSSIDYAEPLRRDNWPLPLPDDREGYYGEDHFSYWASGLADARLLLEVAAGHGIMRPAAYLDLGCATGRVTRHMAHEQPSMKTFGCDINRLHVEWCNSYLPPSITTFQNSSIPTLPLESNTFDLVTAYSVFTHIEAMETSWLMELRRILRPGGIAWITVHTEGTLREMTPDWPLWNPVMKHPDAGQRFDVGTRSFEGNRMVLRWSSERSYSSNVFYKAGYLRDSWSRLMEVVEFHKRASSYQDVIVLRKS